MWNMTLIDIETTVEKTCWKVLHDRSVPDHVREARKRGLLILGQIFLSKGNALPIEQVLSQVVTQSMNQGGAPTSHEV
jgi:hypothetical protein